MIKRTLTILLITIIFGSLIYVLLVRFGYIYYPKNQPLQIITDMNVQKKAYPQSPSSISISLADSIEPMTATNYKFHQTEFAEAESLFANPYSSDEFILDRGKQRYETFCVPCHGFDGKGRGKVITDVKLAADEEGFPPPADLTGPNAVKMSDARLFHILSAGQNLMFPVNDKLEESERWAIVNYIRKLQYESKNQ